MALRKKSIIPLYSVVSAALLMVAAPAARADGSFRTVLVIDASSSMKRTDPNNLRKVAAELYVDLARNGDQIAVTGFDEAARDSTGAFITIDGPEARQKLKDAIGVIGNDGAWTDFAAGLDEAKRLLATGAKRPGDQSLIVFLTDGKCEPGRKGAQEACHAAVLDEVVPSLDAARVYAIGLSQQAPRPFLEELGRRTGGAGEVTLTPAELPRLFAGVYARLLGSRLQEGDVAGETTFEVYEGAQTLDLVIVGRTDKTGTLHDPSGREVPLHNRQPDEYYFVGAKEYRFYKVARPRSGTWKLAVTGRDTRQFAALQHFDLELALVQWPEAAEMGRPMSITARLASPAGAVPPTEFLDRHIMWLVVADGDAQKRVEMKRQPDGTFRVEHTPAKMGTLTVALALEPGADGVLSRATGPLGSIEVVPPLKLVAAPVTFAPIKQSARGTATLSVAGSELGVPIDAAVALEADGLRVEPATITLTPDGSREIELTLIVRKNAPAGTGQHVLRLTPTQPTGFADRAIDVPLAVDITALSFWERFGRFVLFGAGGLVTLLLLLGLVLPARFPKRAILYYQDVRDPDTARRSSYPLGTKAKAGFYRAAHVAVGPTGPVKKGGTVVLTAASGGKIVAAPTSSSATVFRVPADDDDGGGSGGGDVLGTSDDDRRKVHLGADGSFRMTAGARYEIDGSGLVFWYK